MNRLQLRLIVVVISLFAIASCNSEGKPKSTGYTALQWGEYLYYYNKMDSAFLKFNQAANNGGTALERGKAFNYMGMMQRNAGDLYGAQESLTSALRTLDRNNPEHRELITYVYNELGNASLDLKRYEEAITFYDSALQSTTEKPYILEILNGKATTLQKERRYNEAISLYDSILKLNPGNQVLVARAISNRAKTRWLKDPSYPALNEYRKAMQIRFDSADNSGLNASFAHLSDYYAGVQPDSALYYAGRMQSQAITNNSPDDILEAKDKLIRLSNTTAEKDRLYKEYKSLNDSLQLSRDTTRSRYAMIRYDVQKSKADNLALQQHITLQRVLMSAIAVAAVALLVGSILWSLRRRQKLKQRAELEIRNSKIATSQKVHDVVANGLYRIMNELEHRDEIDKEPLLNTIEELYEKSRDISYEDLHPETTTNHSEIHKLLASYQNDERRVIGINNNQEFWQHVTSIQQKQLQLILSELMVNMKKHSKATAVVVQFKLENEKAFITYKDNGVGFDPDHKSGNGLKNTVSRIKSLNGQITFEKNGEKGVAIELSFPLENILI